MGLDTSHDCWHGHYSMFMGWRKWLADQLELPPLELMDGFYAPLDSRDLPTLYAGGKEKESRSLQNLDKQLPIMWACLKFDPIHELLFHSDCEGEIEWEKCETLAERLEAIAEEADDDTEVGKPARGTYDGMVPATRRFAAGLRTAFAAQENVDFH